MTGSLSGVTFTRTTMPPSQMGGAPCVRGPRIPVSAVVDMAADGMAVDEILGAFPDLEPDDVIEALRYAADALRARELPRTAGRLRLLVDKALSSRLAEASRSARHVRDHALSPRV